MRLVVETGFVAMRWVIKHEEWVKKSLEKGESRGDLYMLCQRLREGFEHLWRVEGEEAWAIGRESVRARDGKTVYVLWLGGGSLLLMRRAIELIEEWARERKYATLIIQGRRGWKRVLESSGFELMSLAMGKSLEG